MIDSKYNLPDIGRLNKVHHEGVPHSKVFQHFIFCSESTQIVMEFDGDYSVSVRGFYGENWYSSFHRLIVTPYYREALAAWYDAISFQLMILSDRHGFERELAQDFTGSLL